DVDQLAGGERLAVALGAGAHRRVTGQHGADLRLAHTGLDQLLDEHVTELGARRSRLGAVGTDRGGREDATVDRGLRVLVGPQHAALLDRDRKDQPLGGAAVVLADDDVLRDVHQTTGQVARLGGLQRRVRQALAGTVRGDEVLQDREPHHRMRIPGRRHRLARLPLELRPGRLGSGRGTRTGLGRTGRGGAAGHPGHTSPARSGRTAPARSGRIARERPGRIAREEEAMIEIDNLSIRYGDRHVLDQVSAHVPEGELTLVVGPTGAGKSTLLGALSARVPHTTGGTVAGRVTVAGRDTRTHRPRDLADVLGMVGQDPVATFTTETVEDELAFTMEQLGIAPQLMRRRVEDVLDLLDLTALRGRSLSTLSGGQAQRVAIGAVLTAQPRILVLDEPTSALDPAAAEDVLAALARLVHDAGLTVVLAEHRLERVTGFADQVISLEPGPRGARAQVGEVARVLADAPVAPPVVQLGRLAGWDPPPLTIRQARRMAGELRTRVRSAVVPAEPEAGTSLLQAMGLQLSYGPVQALTGIDLEVRAGQVTAVLGRNGAGKSSLLWALAGQQKLTSGRVRGHSCAALVPQSPQDVLFRLSVAAECEAADAHAQRPGRTRTLLDRLAPGIEAWANPRDLSEGQRLALALAVQLAPDPQVLLLDEPTRGLDYAAKERLAQLVRDLTGRDKAVLLASHDVEFVAQVATRVVQLAAGEVVADGAAPALLTDSAFTAPQVARILAPSPLLTVGQVREALGQSG